MQQAFELAKRTRPGFRAFCATVDLLGVSEMMMEAPKEAAQRLNDLQEGFGEALLVLYPRGPAYRMCFAGDCWFVVQEVSPDEDTDELWPLFCGHVFALASCLHILETNWELPGVRVVVSYGPLLQICEPESWRRYDTEGYTSNWMVLTGASTALAKCTKVESLGKNSGFDGGYFWHEIPDSEGEYLGSRFFEVQPARCWRPEIYADVYRRLCDTAARRVGKPPDGDARKSRRAVDFVGNLAIGGSR